MTKRTLEELAPLAAYLLAVFGRSMCSNHGNLNDRDGFDAHNYAARVYECAQGMFRDPR